MSSAAIESQVEEHRLDRTGRTVAWTRVGRPSGTTVVRFPGTPSCRLAVPIDLKPWQQRGLCCLTCERPGFGASTRLPGRRFREHADDVAAILDTMGLATVHIIGVSGGGPHALAFAAFHPDRVSAATVVSGAAPFNAVEAPSVADTNVRAVELAQAGDVAGLTAMLSDLRDKLLADPYRVLRRLSSDAPEADRAALDQARDAIVKTVVEALSQGPEGWVDEAMALDTSWDFEPAEIATSVTWWHSPVDRFASFAAAKRLVSRMPNASLKPLAGGHVAFRHDDVILDDLLSRGRNRTG